MVRVKGQGGHPATKSRPAVFFPTHQAADGTMGAPGRSPRESSHPDWETPLAGPCSQSLDLRRTKPHKGSRWWWRLNIRKLTIWRIQHCFWEDNVHLFLLTVHRYFCLFGWFFCSALELGGISESASPRFISRLPRRHYWQRTHLLGNDAGDV